MRVEILQNGRVLRSLTHEGQQYIEAPPSGPYAIRLTNNTAFRRMAVLSVDGVNVISGDDASYSGPGYVLSPWQSCTIKGWMRSNSEVAAFEFRPNEGSYATATGRGTKNNGVIGVAVFEEKIEPKYVPPVVIERHIHHHHHDWYPSYPFTWVSSQGALSSASPSVVSNSTDGVLREISEISESSQVCGTLGHPISSSTHDHDSLGGSVTRSLASRNSPTKSRSEPVDLGTGYGSRLTQYTDTTTFRRASESPVLVLSLMYATTERLQSWGVPIEPPAHENPSRPEAFPAQKGFVQPPPNWRG